MAISFFNRFSAFLVPLVFFTIGLATLYDYGMNWDSPIHFARGQAYLRYMLTGKTNYDGLPKYCMNSENVGSRRDSETGEVCDRHRSVRVSEYESGLLDFDSRVAKSAYGHPAFSDIMLAASNSIFFKGLGWVEDINAYHLYSLFTTFLLALAVSIWVKQTFGTFASFISVLTIYSFPLLFGESHFNVKDPPMAAFFTIALYFLWLAITRGKARYLYLSALAGGASLGTKLNFVFAPFILLPWVIAYLGNARTNWTKFLSKRMIVAFAFYPVIVFLVFFASWPALWPNPIKNITEVIQYYHDVGGSKCAYFYFTTPWFTKCTQLTTLQYFFYTLPPVSIILFLVGFIASLVKLKEKKYVVLIWLSFFSFTVLRVTLSLTGIYGGLRQILEFIAPMAMIAGLGALSLRNLLVRIFARLLTQKPGKRAVIFVASLIITLGYIPIFLQIIKMHPNQNVYFNFLIGGLKGAEEKDFPGYGNTYGNAYLQGIAWLNQNAEPNSRFGLVSGNAQNISRATLREDIDFSNGSRSGYNQEGEYLMLMVVGQDPSSETFRYKYLSLLDPLYDLRVDSVSLLKIWKNDKHHLRAGIKIDGAREPIKARINDKEKIIIDLGEKRNLKALGFIFPSPECKEKIIGAKIFISPDGNQYMQKPESVNNFTEREISGYNADLVYLFPGDEAQYIKVIPPTSYPCKLSNIGLSVFIFVQLYNPN